MFWVTFCLDTLLSIIHVECICIPPFVHDLWKTAIYDDIDILRLVNAPYYTAHVWESFQKHEELFIMVPWLPNSLDLHFIEHLSNVLEQQICSSETSSAKGVAANIWHQKKNF